MSRSWYRHAANPRVTRAVYDPRVISAVVLLFVAASSIANPLPAETTALRNVNQSSTTIESLLAAQNSTNSTPSDLYVIRAVVYEIGILTDIDNSTNDTTERHEEVNISFYDPPHKENGLLDLSGIPVPQVIAPLTNGTSV